MEPYLGDKVWVQLTCLVNHFLKFLPGHQRDVVSLLFHKMQQRLHFLTSEVQHWVQVINHAVFKHTRGHNILRLDMIQVDCANAKMLYQCNV